MNEVKYFVFPVGKPEEKFEVSPHTAGEGVFSFAKPAEGEAWENAELYTFANEGQDGAFVNNDILQADVTGTYDIVKEEIVVEEETEVTE
jgi:hypothetical protein